MKKLILSSVVAVAIFGGVSYAKDSYIDDAINLAKDAAVTATVEAVSSSVTTATTPTVITTVAGTTCATLLAPALFGAAAMVGAIWGVSMMLKD